MLATATLSVESNNMSGSRSSSQRSLEMQSPRGSESSTCATAQTHMILSLYHFAKGNDDLSLSNYGSAVRCVGRLRFTTERYCMDQSSTNGQSRTEFAVTGAQLAECKKRTFWSTLLMDRNCGATTCENKPEDIFIRLPCTDDMYERGVPSDAPYLSNGIFDPSESIITAASPIARMAWLIIVAVLWSNVVDSTFRAWHRAPVLLRRRLQCILRRNKSATTRLALTLATTLVV